MRRRDLLIGAGASAVAGRAEAAPRLLWMSGGNISPNAAASAFYARLSSQPTAAQQQIYNRLFRDLSPYWSRFDAVYIAALGIANTQANALTNLVSVSYGLTKVGTGSFSNSGWTGDGSTGYLTTGFVPSTAGGNYTLNSAAFGGYVTNARYFGANYAIMGDRSTGSATNGCHLFPWYTDNNVYGECNGNATGNYVGMTSGMWCETRQASGTSNLYHNGYLYNSLSVSSVSLPNQGFVLGAGRNGSGGAVSAFSADTHSCWFIGGGFSATEIAAITTIFNAAMKAIGVNTFGTGKQYNYLYFCNVSLQKGLTVVGTNDSKTLSDALTSKAVSPTGNMIATPTAMVDANGVMWMVSNITNASGAGQSQLYQELYKCVPPYTGLQFSYVGQINWTDVIGAGSSAMVYSAQFFTDNNGDIYIEVSGSADQSSDTGFALYYKKAINNNDLSAGFGSSTAFTITGIGANVIDPMTFLVGGTYYKFYKVEGSGANTRIINLATASSFTGTYTIIESAANWAGGGAIWGTVGAQGIYEAPYVRQFGNTYRILLDSTPGGTDKMWYSDLNGSLPGAGSWSAVTQVTANFNPQHSMTIPTPAGYTN